MVWTAGVRAWARTSAGATYCSSSTVSEGNLLASGLRVPWGYEWPGVRAWARTSAGVTYCSSSTVSEGSFWPQG